MKFQQGVSSLTKLPDVNKNIYFAHIHIYHILLLNNCNTHAKRKAVAIIISRCGCGCHRKRQSPVASCRLTGNHKHPWQRAGRSSASLHLMLAWIRGATSCCAPSCTWVLRPFHFAFHFIINFFSLFAAPPSPPLPACLFLLLVGFCAELCKL